MRFIRRLLLLIILLVLVAGTVLWFLPASFVYEHFGDRLGSSVVLRDVSGTVRQGRAGQVLINGFPVGTLEWTLDWRRLLKREIKADWRLADTAWSASGTSARLADGSIRMNDMRMQLPALLLQPVLDVPALNFLGTVDVTLDTLRLRGMIIEEARGHARWYDAGVTGQAQARFGPLQTHFATTAPGHVIGEVEDEGGPLSVDGKFELNGTNYHAEVLLHARDPQDPVAQVLYYIGQALPDGGSMLVVDGELKRHADPGDTGG
jgi:general secretion pathway protein N